jgi:hypothetical protein
MVFISHAGENAGAARELCRALEDAGTPCWIAPRDIPPAAPWPAAIVQAIQGSQCVVVLVSRFSMASRQVAREVELSDNQNRPLLAVRLDETDLTGDLSYFLLNTQWYDAAGEFTRSLPGIVAAVRDLLTPDALEAIDVPVIPRGRDPLRMVVVELRRVAAAWLGIVSRGRRFVQTVEIEDLRTVVFSLRFLLYMQAIAAVLALSLVDFAQRSPARYVFSQIVSGFVENFGGILVFYAAFRLFGGAGSLAGSATVCSLYTAFEPILTLILAPSRIYLEPFFRLDLRTASPEQIVEAFTRYATPVSMVILLACLAAATIVILIALVSLAGSLRLIHRLPVARSVFAMAAGCVAYVVYVFVIGIPFARALYR